MNISKIGSNDSGENSIMQTVSIAVSAILIAAGLITAPSLINNARDTNAKQDLANIAHAQEYHLSDKGAYSNNLGAFNESLRLTTAAANNEIALIPAGPPYCYTTFVHSASGKIFFRASASSKITEVPSPWPVTPPVSWPACGVWPSNASLVDATRVEVTNLLASANASSLNGISSAGATGTESIGASGGQDGTFARKTFSTTGFGGLYFGSYTAYRPVVVPGKTYTASGYARLSVNQPIQIRVEWKDPTGVILSSSYGPDITPTIGAWTRLSTTGVAPSGSASATITFYTNTPWPVGAVEDIDSVMFTEGSTLHSYSDGNSPGWRWTGVNGESTSIGYPIVN